MNLQCSLGGVEFLLIHDLDYLFRIVGMREFTLPVALEEMERHLGNRPGRKLEFGITPGRMVNFA